MNLIEKTRAVHHSMLEAYFSTRDLDAVIGRFDPEIMWFGTGKNDTARNYDSAVSMLRREQAAFAGRFQIVHSDFEVSQISPVILHVFGELELSSEEGALRLPTLFLRYTALYRPDGDTVRLYRLHLSQPSQQQGENEFFPSILKEEDAFLKKLLDEKTLEISEKNRILEALMNNIPGGVQNCLNDAYFTILNANERFLSMFGYAKDDLARLYGNRYIEIIHPEDRETALATVRRQLQSGNTIELEYRVRCRDGSYKWVLDKGELVKAEQGTDEIYCVIVDISDQKQEREELRMAYERYQIVMNQTDDIIFEWDFADDRVNFSHNWQTNFRHIALHEKATFQLLSHSQNIHSDDLALFEGFIQKILDGNAYTEEEVRIKSDTGAYLWYCIRVTLIYDKDQKPLKAVGVMVNIDDAKRQTEKLTERASRDALTGLYNRAEAFRLVAEHLAQSQQQEHTLMMMDIDNFKQINDTKGHLFGDTVLQDIGRMLKKLFRSTDIVGRIGGDEFVTFLPGTNSRAVIEEKANRVIAGMKAIFPSDYDVSVSCSIGIASTPDCGTDFHALYASADRALYSAKHDGKNCFRFFQAELPESYFDQPSPAGRAQCAETAQANDLNIGKVFHSLYTAPDLDAAVNALLHHLCRHYNASRAYIFERSEDGLFYNNTFEWCEEGVEPQIAFLQNIPAFDGQFAYYERHFDENGIFYCKDIRDLAPTVYEGLASQGIKAMLQCAILNGPAFRGFVGFDDCCKRRYWVRAEVETLSLISEIIGVFLLKRRLERRASSCEEHGR